jgi:hypothetical protein
MSNKITVPTTEGVKYVVYTSEAPEITSAGYSFNESAYGYVIAMDTKGNSEVKVIGKADDCVEYSGIRAFYARISSTTSFTLNGVSICQPRGMWVQGTDGTPSAFASIRGKMLEIDMAENGYYCVNYKKLFLLKDIEMNQPVTIETDENGESYFFVGEGDISFFYAGSQEHIGGMLTIDPSNTRKIMIPKNITLNENFFFKTVEGNGRISFTDVLLKEIPIRKISVPSDFSDKYNPLAMYRATPVAIPYIDNTMKSIDVTATRYNGEVKTLNIEIEWMSKDQEKFLNITLSLLHAKEEAWIDFTDPYFPPVESINGEPPGPVEIKGWYSSLSYVLKSGERGEANIYIESKPYDNVFMPERRYSIGDQLGPFKSPGAYMIGANVYRNAVDEKNFSTTFDGEVLTITIHEEINGYGIYNDEQSVWTMTALKKRIEFDKSYRMLLTAAQDLNIDLSIFGSYDTTDKFTYTVSRQVGGGAIKDGKFKLKVPGKDIASGTVLGTATFSAMETQGQVFAFDVSFVYEEFSRVFFLVPGRDGFSTAPMRRTASFSGGSHIPYWMYGQFYAQEGAIINAYGNQVSEDSTSSNIYPIVKFTNPGIATVIETNNSLEIHTDVLKDDINIPVGKEDMFIPLNKCAELMIKNSMCKVLKTTSVAFFRLGNRIYLFCAPKKTSTQEEEPSKSISRRGSFRGPSAPRSSSSPRLFASATPYSAAKNSPDMTDTSDIVDASIVETTTAGVPQGAVLAPLIDSTMVNANAPDISGFDIPVQGFRPATSDPDTEVQTSISSRQTHLAPDVVQSMGATVPTMVAAHTGPIRRIPRPVVLNSGIKKSEASGVVPMTTTGMPSASPANKMSPVTEPAPTLTPVAKPVRAGVQVVRRATKSAVSNMAQKTQETPSVIQGTDAGAEVISNTTTPLTVANAVVSGDSIKEEVVGVSSVSKAEKSSSSSPIMVFVPRIVRNAAASGKKTLRLRA